MIRERILFRLFFSLLLLLSFSPFCTYEPTSQIHPSMRTLEQFDIKIPSFDEQRRIVSILDRFDALCNDLTNGLPAEIAARQKQYEYYRDKLLQF